jgi:hypothetical protein
MLSCRISTQSPSVLFSSRLTLRGMRHWSSPVATAKAVMFSNIFACHGPSRNSLDGREAQTFASCRVCRFDHYGLRWRVLVAFHPVLHVTPGPSCLSFLQLFHKVEVQCQCNNDNHPLQHLPVGCRSRQMLTGWVA